MSSSSARPARQTIARRLLKLASLGLAGLLAGLLSGCNAPPDAPTSPHLSSNVDFIPTTSQSPNLPASIDARQIPALHHSPSARRLQDESTRITGEPVVPPGRTRS
jgi:hypothetical protein